MFKTSQLLKNSASLSSNKIMSATKCPLNKTARNLYISYITVAIAAPFLYSYLHTDRIKYDSFYIDSPESETCKNYSKKKTQHSVRYIF